MLRLVVDKRRPLATAKSKNPCHKNHVHNGASTHEAPPRLLKRPRRGIVNIHATAPESLRRRQRSGDRPGHHDQRRANMFITGRRRRRQHRRLHRGIEHPPSVLLLLRLRRTASRRRTGLGLVQSSSYSPFAKKVSGRTAHRR
jgi:hypothetical protein